MSPHYKLHYFDLRGLGEVSRMIFAQVKNFYRCMWHLLFKAGVKYEDHRYQYPSTDWKAGNSLGAPFDQLPVLEIDGDVKIAQSCAIARYLARQYGLAGKSPYEEAVVDSLADAFKDFYNETREFFALAFGFGQGDQEKIYMEKVVPAKEKLFPAIEKFLEMSGSGFLVGNSVTWVDLFLAERLGTFHEYASQLFDGYPEIPKWIQHVMDLPNISKWIKERPKSKF